MAEDLQKDATRSRIESSDRIPASNGATLADLVREIFRIKWWLAGCFLVPAILAFLIGITLDPEYRSTSVLTITSDNSASGLDSLAGQLGGFARIAGISIGASDESSEAVEYLKSRSLAREFIESNDLIPVLFEEKWDSEQSKWLTDNPDGPTMQKAVKRFRESVRSVNKDPVAEIVRVEMRWHDRELAARWAHEYVELANEKMRSRVIEESRKTMDFLSDELESAQSLGLKQAISRLMQSELNNAMLANVRKDYRFRVLDPPVVPDEDEYIWPRPVLFAAVAGLIGFILGLGGASLRRKSLYPGIPPAG